MTKFILLRHGQTDWNLQRRYQGQSDIALNETGEAQSQLAGTQLRNMPLDVIYSSDLIRARDTAMAVKQYHPNTPIHFDQRIRERSFGDFEGKSYEKDLMNPGLAGDMHRNPVTFRFPGGESLMDVSVRAQEFLTEMLEKHPDETVLIVSHGSFLTIFSALYYQEDLINRKKFIFNNAEPVFMEKQPEQP